MTRMSSARAAAVRRALQAKQERDSKRLARERQIEAALTDFYEQTGRAEQVRAHAQARAARIVAEADDEAGELLAAAAASVARLEEFGEPRAVIAELTGLSRAEVRELLIRAKATAAVTEPVPGEATGVRPGASVTGRPDATTAVEPARARTGPALERAEE